MLIANRGEIACRIIRTCQKMGIKTVAVFSDADVAAPHVSMANEAINIGPPEAANSYLNIKALIDAAKQTGAQAIHPGYGFLSEKVEFCMACEAAGIIFIGPSTNSMNQFAQKDVARAFAHKHGVPIVPGTELITNVRVAEKEADRIGFPVVVKCAGGGGGIGMQRCNSRWELAEALESAARTASTYFGHSGVYLEKCIQKPHHIEIQIFGDGNGTVLALNERECSIQRRFQKIVEETPSPFVEMKGAAFRQTMCSSAVALGQAAKYKSAGTVEFIVDDDSDQYYFLEVNTRLQVEHAVTELVSGIDLVEWMILEADGRCPNLSAVPRPFTGHAIEVRIYAEDPGNNYRPSSGTLTEVVWPKQSYARYDNWVRTGTQVTPYYDPLLCKVVVHGSNRAEAVSRLSEVLDGCRVGGIPTNLGFLRQISKEEDYKKGRTTTLFVTQHPYTPKTIDVLNAGLMTTIQDYPGRLGYWDVGVSPSGPMDDLSFRIANALVGNKGDEAGLEITLVGPALRFNCPAVIAVAGANIAMELELADETLLTVPMFTSYHVAAGSTLRLAKTTGCGCRSYLAIHGGIDVPFYLGSRSTFTLGKMGGLQGKALVVGDVLPIFPTNANHPQRVLPSHLCPPLVQQWDIAVLYGPHGAPDFFTRKSIDDFFSQPYVVLPNSNRLGVRLDGPTPEWTRTDGGEAGLHPSNIHDCVYAIGSVNFTGNFPVILTCDGPSLGGFVCPATIIASDMWKVGQANPGDEIRFCKVTYEYALSQQTHLEHYIRSIAAAAPIALNPLARSFPFSPHDVILYDNGAVDPMRSVVFRLAGDQSVLIEVGPMILDINLRCKIERVQQWLQRKQNTGILELGPGVRSLQIKYDTHRITLKDLLPLLEEACALPDTPLRTPSRILSLPFAFDDKWTAEARQRYMTTFGTRKPYLPSNVDFVARVNGLRNRDDVGKFVTDASYLVLGLGDVYLGAPCATPMDPRHRLVTSKYSPARTFTPEGAVGIGGCYMCIYGMESPGGYQLVGRTLPIWDTFTQHPAFSKPWMLRNFDQVRFFMVTDAQLQAMRVEFASGMLKIKIENAVFDQKEYNQFLDSIRDTTASFQAKQQAAFAEERHRWELAGMMGGTADATNKPVEIKTPVLVRSIPSGSVAVEAITAGTIRRIFSKKGEVFKRHAAVLTIEAMKMELSVEAPVTGTVGEIFVQVGESVTQGAILAYMFKT